MLYFKFFMEFHILKVRKIVIEKERKYYIQKEKNTIHFTIIHILLPLRCRDINIP